jgi:class 3 adenylate cyclase/NAD(P)-dependent dehydrogenase (short-subunit alcohol dehydrogenase family)
MNSLALDLIKQMAVPPNAFAGRTALITGGARGIGEATAHLLSRLGADVIIADILPQGQGVADAMKSHGGRAHFIRCDLASVSEVLGLVAEAPRVFGPIDILMNNAMKMVVAPITEASLEQWENVVNVNLRAAFLTIHHLLPSMLERRHGIVVNMIAYEGSPLTAAYAATKVGSRSLVLTAAREVGDDSGVAIYAFVPGVVDTPVIHETLAPGIASRIGLSTDEVISTILSQNPGYGGLVPVEHCTAALVYTLHHADEYHGQVADPFEPLSRHGIIQNPPVPEDLMVALGPEVALPQHLKQYLTNVNQLNRELEHRIELRTRELAEAHRQSEALLLNVLPASIAERLKHTQAIIADYFEAVTVLFADIVNFTPMSARLAPQRVVEILDVVFTVFDGIADRHSLEKIKTIGDCYMMVGGLPEAMPDHADAVARAALDIQKALMSISHDQSISLSVRIGMHTGSVVAGVIGRHKFIYDLWGDTVNTASRMESHGVANKIQCTKEVVDALGDRYVFEPRGEIDVKGKGLMQTYFLVTSRGRVARST